MSALFTLNLTAEEAAMLDGKVGAEAQKVVARAVDALTLAPLGEKQAAMVATVLSVAREKGRLTFDLTMVRSCPCCGRSDGYWPVKRSTRYKVKGRPDYDNPKVFRAFNLDRGFVTVQHHIGVGFCESCCAAVEPVIRQRLMDIPCETPAHWKGMPQRYRRWDHRKCSQCGWEGHEGQMRPGRTFMGDGFYQAGCPSCPAVNVPLGRTLIDRVEGWTLVALSSAAQVAVTDPGTTKNPAKPEGEGHE